MSNWERRWRILMVLLREHQIKVKMLSAELEAADSTIRADLAQLALNFPLESRRGPNGGYRLSTQPPFAKHASFLALLMANLERAGRLNQQQEQLMQEAILALTVPAADRCRGYAQCDGSKFSCDDRFWWLAGRSTGVWSASACFAY